ncbi:MAG: nucleotidyltransferase family protein [Aestuariivirga sp.]
MKIAALVLAAGTSSRMGSNKLLADMGGRPLIMRTVQNILASQVNKVFVVTGHQSDEVKAALQSEEVEFAYNSEFASGLASSVREGVAVAKDFDGVLVCLGDMPLVSPQILDKMIETYDFAQGRDLVVPTYEGKFGNPVLWGSRYFPELAALRGDRGARELIDRYRERVIGIEVGDEAVALDADTPEALAHIKSIAGF